MTDNAVVADELDAIPHLVCSIDLLDRNQTAVCEHLFTFRDTGELRYFPEYLAIVLILLRHTTTEDL